MIVTAVVPTFNRGSRLGATLDRLLASNVEGLDGVEIVVVDDGSLQSAAPIVESRQAAHRFSIRYIRQENAGPAAARNTGFRASNGDIVLFVDDDILCPPDLIHQHVAVHRAYPGSVVFGDCQLVAPDVHTPLFGFVTSLRESVDINGPENCIPVRIVASGQISFERMMFDPNTGIYRDDLATPAAEEYELSLRLRTRCIQVLYAPQIVAWHDHPVKLRSMCAQAFKHGMGCAEAVVKCRETMDLSEVAGIMGANGPITRMDALALAAKKVVKQLISASPIRHIVFTGTRACEAILPQGRLLRGLYRILLGTFFFKGVRTGLQRFSPTDMDRLRKPSDNACAGCIQQ